MSDTPRTEAGRALGPAFDRWMTTVGQDDFRDTLRQFILAIEAEAAATSSPAGNGEPPEKRLVNYETAICPDCTPKVIEVRHADDCPWRDPDTETTIEGTRDAAPGCADCDQPHWDVTHGAGGTHFYRPTPPSEAPSKAALISDPDAAPYQSAEAPSGGLDPDRLARALVGPLTHDLGYAPWDEQKPEGWRWTSLAADVIAEYNRLSPTPGQGDSE